MEVACRVLPHLGFIQSLSQLDMMVSFMVTCHAQVSQVTVTVAYVILGYAVYLLGFHRM